MIVVVKTPFRDLYDYEKIYDIGDVIDVSDERAQNMIKLGLAESGKKAEPEKPTEKAEPEKSEPTPNFFAQSDDTPKRKRNKE